MVRGTAALWATRQTQLLGTRGGANTLVEFEKRLRAAFGDPDEGTTARAELGKLKQGGRPVDDYIVEFELREYKSGLDDLALTELYKQGLNLELFRECHRDRPVAVTLDEWKEQSRLHDRAARALKEALANRGDAPRAPAYPTRRPGFGNPNFQSSRAWPAQGQNPGSRFSPPQGPPPNRLPTGRSMPAIRNPQTPIRPEYNLSPGQSPIAVDRFRQGARTGYQQRPPIKCFRCGLLGHRMAECTTRMEIRAAGEEEQVAGREANPRTNEEQQGFSEVEGQ